jgi:hypothetical protein
MTIAIFAICYLTGAVALALWVDVRFPKIRPTSWGRVGIAVGVSMLIDQFCTLGLKVGPQLVGVIGVVLPALAISCLASIWMLRMMRASMPG